MSTTLEEIVRRIVKIADPDKIILFGSTARGEMGPHSNFDLLVVKTGDYHRGRLTEEIYLGLVGIKQAVDVIVAKPEDIERYCDIHALVIKAALRDGKVIYEREPTPAR